MRALRSKLIFCWQNLWASSKKYDSIWLRKADLLMILILSYFPNNSDLSSIYEPYLPPMTKWLGQIDVDGEYKKKRKQKINWIHLSHIKIDECYLPRRKLFFSLSIRSNHFKRYPSVNRHKAHKVFVCWHSWSGGWREQKETK